MPTTAAQPTAAADQRRPLRITVLAGGPSAERAISLESGRAVAEALRHRGHHVHLADIGPSELSALDHPADVVFPALHGPFGEDGTVQRLMQERGLRYVGSDAAASAIAMDKVLTKERAIAANVRTAAYEVWTAQTLAQHEAPALPLPLIVKPVDQGSSVATRVVRETGALRPAVQVAVEQFGRALIEQFIVGSELTVGIVGTQTLPPICIRPKRPFYDYEAKYADDATEYLFDAGFSAALLDRAKELSWRVFTHVGCRHLARVDWIIDAQEQLWFLEVNTLPGFTSHSLVPKAALHAGISFDELCDQLVHMALEEPA